MLFKILQVPDPKNQTLCNDSIYAMIDLSISSFARLDPSPSLNFFGGGGPHSVKLLFQTHQDSSQH